jgi:hypothetical protein
MDDMPANHASPVPHGTHRTVGSSSSSRLTEVDTSDALEAIERTFLSRVA